MVVNIVALETTNTEFHECYKRASALQLTAIPLVPLDWQKDKIFGRTT